MAGSDWAVELEDVHLTLVSAAGPVNVLRGIDLAAVPGETLAVVGPSGSGKTSTLLVAAGLERATQGRVAVAGQDLGGMSEDELAMLRRERIGIVFQSFHLMATMTALENVAVPLELAGRRDALDRARACLEA
ncbi:MAG: ATP-binding cassette domain-containing protein, partial [Alphaproteobacteria bacterium]|nr:ATP-binding cassette domain-containing protein [Alphaproteobacteria bacterium]